MGLPDEAAVKPPAWATQALINRLAEIISSGRIADATSNAIACVALNAVVAASSAWLDTPEGWRPTMTHDMLEAGIASLGSDDDRPSSQVVADCWDAMISAAPPPIPGERPPIGSGEA